MSKSPKPVRRPDKFHDKMDAFDRDMERDEALDLKQLRDHELIKQWLAPQKGRCQ